jgi:hypothetical protein
LAGVRREILARIKGESWTDNGLRDQIFLNTGKGVLVELAHATPDHGLTRTSRIVGKAETWRESVFRLRGEGLIVVPETEVQCKVPIELHLVLDEPHRSVIGEVEVDLTEPDRKPRRVRGRYCWIEGVLALEGDRSVVVVPKDPWPHQAPGVIQADLEGMVAAPAIFDPRKGILNDVGSALAGSVIRSWAG